MEICMARNFLFIHLWRSQIVTERPYGVPDQQMPLTGLWLWPLQHRCAIHNDSHIMGRLSLTRDFQSEWRSTESAPYLPLVRHRRQADCFPQNLKVACITGSVENVSASIASNYLLPPKDKARRPRRPDWTSYVVDESIIACMPGTLRITWVCVCLCQALWTGTCD